MLSSENFVRLFLFIYHLKAKHLRNHKKFPSFLMPQGSKKFILEADSNLPDYSLCSYYHFLFQLIMMIIWSWILLGTLAQFWRNLKFNLFLSVVSTWYCVLYCNCDKVICSWHNCPKKRAQKTYPNSHRPSKERHLAVILLVEKRSRTSQWLEKKRECVHLIKYVEKRGQARFAHILKVHHHNLNHVVL